MNTDKLAVLAFTCKHQVPPCFVVTVVQKHDGSIWAVYPSGDDVVGALTNDSNAPVTREEILADKDLVPAQNGYTLSLDRKEVGFAFSIDDVMIGTHKEVLTEIERRLALLLPERDRYLLNETHEELMDFIAGR